MIALRKGLPLVAGCALLLSAGTASAQISLNDWVIDLTKIGFAGFQTLGPDGLGIDSANFSAPTRVITQDNDNSGTISVNDTQTAVGIGNIGGFEDTGGNSFQNATDGMGGNAFINFNYEVTFVFTINELVTDVTNGNAGFEHTGGQLSLYIDNNINFNANAGTGADDGLLVATFDVVPGAGGGNIDLGNLDGNVNIVFQASFIEEGVLFNTEGTDISTLLDNNDDPLLIAFSDSNFDICTPGGQECDPNQFQPGGAYGDDLPTEFDQLDFFAEENGSINLALLPEPGTMAIFGLGLLGLGIAVRRRQRASA